MLPDGSSRFLARVVGSVVTLILAVPGVDAATMPPRYKFETLKSGRVTVHFHKEVETPARLVMSLALEVLPRLEERYRARVPSLDIVVHDANDSPNGLASSFPYPFVEIRTAGPDGGDSGPTESWLRMVVTHELTHIVHIEEAGGLYRLGRRVLGRAPFLFPNALQPTWFIEGLAVREETRGTAFGRGRHAFTEMVVDEAARAGQLGRLDQATLGLDLWPLGNAPYLFGEEFLAWLEKERGETITQDLALSHASSLRPYLDNLTFQRVTGRSVQTLWTEFSRDRAKSLGGSSGMAVVEPRPLTTRGAVQTSPRLSPDGSTLAYTSRTLDRLGEIRTMRIDGSADRRLTTRTSGSALSWSADGATIVFDETNQVSKFESRSDLYSVDAKTGRRTRLTHGLRASDPDLGPIGPPGQTEIVFVQRFADRSELSLLDLKALKATTLTRSEPGTEWSHPRFSPHGDVIVASRLAQGFSDLVIVDAGKGASRNLLHDRALDVEPSWVDENTIIFRSDREGTGFRLFVISSEGKELSRTSSDAVNAFTPEVDQRTASLFYSTYSSRGYDLARLPFQRGQSPAAFDDTFPANRPNPLPFPGDARPYSCRIRSPRGVGRQDVRQRVVALQQSQRVRRVRAVGRAFRRLQHRK